MTKGNDGFEKKFISTGQFVVALLLLAVTFGGITASVASTLSAHSTDINNMKGSQDKLENKLDKVIDLLLELKRDRGNIRE
jgi:hypothetical protein